MTRAYGINDSGQIVGPWDDSGQGNGFSRLDGTYTNVVYPDAFNTVANGMKGHFLMCGGGRGPSPRQDCPLANNLHYTH